MSRLPTKLFPLFSISPLRAAEGPSALAVFESLAPRCGFSVEFGLRAGFCESGAGCRLILGPECRLVLSIPWAWVPEVRLRLPAATGCGDVRARFRFAALPGGPKSLAPLFSWHPPVKQSHLHAAVKQLDSSARRVIKKRVIFIRRDGIFLTHPPSRALLGDVPWGC